MALPHRALGTGGLSASTIGLGCMSLSGVYGEADDAKSEELIRYAIDLGVDHLDSSDMYGWGHNELVIGRAIKGRRDKVVLATKFGQTQRPGQSNGVNGRPEYVQQACEASLRRLRISTIDLYYQHRVDPEVPIEETVGAMSRLVEQGKVRWIGLSEASAQTLRRAAKVVTISSLQTEYSLWERGVEAEILPTCRELGIGFIPYSPLGRGFLSGKHQDSYAFADGDVRLRMPRFQGDNFERNRHWLERIRQMAAEKKCTPAQLALAWVLSRGEDVVPIPGTKHMKYLEENIAASALTLTPEEIAHLDELTKDGVAGERYPSHSMPGVNA
jgi:aryl-alcohol dehydrogenase-like predicted oxidoreductase